LNKILNETAQTQTAVADDKTISFGTHNIPTGEQPVGTNPIQSMRQEMAQQMGYGDMRMGGASKPQAGGLGVQTGLPGLDKILNRDNSELVKRFKR
jgi:hypothetical protein